MMVRRDEFLALGGFYEPIFMYGEEADYCLRVRGRTVLHPASAVRHVRGHAAGPHRSTLRLYWPSRNRLVNAARHLPRGAFAKSVLASAAFDLVTIAQTRDRGVARAIACGWRDGLTMIKRERGVRTRAEKKRAASRVVSFREALAQQRRLGRI
jgi:GT2 family glycosyltransferase